MDEALPPRTTIDQVDSAMQVDEQTKLIVDAGRRRHQSWGMNFDTRALSLTQEIGKQWEVSFKAQHRANRGAVRRGLLAEFGEMAADAKAENFIAIGTKPFSVLSYHNAFFIRSEAPSS